jgi:hypothetical protein
VIVIVDPLSLLVINSLKIEEEEALTLLSGSKNSSISNIKSKILMTVSIFKEQEKVKIQD